MRKPAAIMWIWATSSLVLLLVTAACDSSRSTRNLSKAVQVQISSEPVSLDPALAEDGVALRIIANTMEGLVCHDANGELHACLADRIEVSPDWKRYEFQIRASARWSDGEAVRARHFVDGITRSLAPETSGKQVEHFLLIRGAKAFHARKAPESQLGLKASRQGANEKLVIELEEPAPYFLEALSLTPALPIRKDFLEPDGGWSTSMPVTGAYKYGLQKPGEMRVLEPNQNYWRRLEGKQGSYPAVVLRLIQDLSTAVSLFESGRIDLITKEVPALDLKRLKEQGRVKTDPFRATYFLSFNTKKAPFDRRDVRRAVAGAIRKEEIVAALSAGERPARGWVPDGLEGHVPYADLSSKYADSLKKLAGQKLPAVVAGFDSGSRNSMIMEKVQQDLKKIGLTVKLENTDWKTYVKGLTTDPPAMFRFGWLAPFNDAITHLQVFVSGSPNNYTSWSNREYDRLVAEISKMPRGAGRAEKIRKAQAILEDEAIVVPIYHYVQTHAVAARVEGFKVNPFGTVRFDGLKLLK